MKTRLLQIAVLCLVSVMLVAASSFAEETKHLAYDNPDNWSFWAQGEEKPADLFIICPTVDMGRNGNVLMDCSDDNLRSSFTGALNMELGIYADVCSIYAPFYQQVTFPVYSMGPEAEAYFDFAYGDVRLAFLHYLENSDAQRPLVLAGFSQGADMAIRLVKEFFAEKAIADRLVAVYAIGWRVTEDELRAYPHLRMAQEESDTGVVVSFNSEAESATDSMLVPEGVRTYAINPLNWRTDGTVADASLNLGACFTDYSGDINSEINAFCSAYLDETRGTLKVPDVDPAAYPGIIFPDGIYHLYDYQFFFRNLQKNVSVRLDAWQGNR